MRPLAATLAMACVASPALAQNVGAGPSDAELIGRSYGVPSASRAPGRGEPSLRVAGGYLRQFESTLPQGSFEVNRAYASVSGSMPLSGSVQFAPSIAYEFGDYSFSGAASGAFPWDRVDELGIAPRFDIALGERMTVSVAPLVQFAAESGAAWSDAVQWGGIGSFRYVVSEDLALGAGILGTTQLEGDPLIIPIPLIDWKIDRNWRVSNLRVPEANPFAALEVIYDTHDTLEFAAGGGWENRRFRLDEGGVGQDRGAAFYARATARIGEQFRIDALVGFSAFNQLKTIDPSGTTTASQSGDPGLILGIFGSFRF